MDDLPDIALAETPQGTVLEVTYNTIRGLGLAAIPQENIVMRRVSWDDGLKLPYVIVRLLDENSNPDEGNTAQDIWHFGVMVSIVSANNRRVGVEKFGTFLAWRWAVETAFHNRNSFPVVGAPAMPAGTCLKRTTVRQGEPYLDPALRANYDAQYVLVNFEVMVTR